MPVRDQFERCTDPSLNAMHAGLADVIGRWLKREGDSSTSIDNLLFFRREALTEPCACMVEPSIVFVVQGSKQLLIGDQSFVYDTGSFLLNSLDIPASSQVLDASVNRPCLGLVLKLDLRLMAELITQSGLPTPCDRATSGSTAIGTMTPALLEPFCRLLALLNDPVAIRVVAPLIEREIHFHLLRSNLAARLWQIASVGSQSHRIARAINWLRANYAQPLSIDELAIHAQMSTSTLHHHFRLLTAMSPLQYQKWLRLSEARRLMLNERFDAASAAFQVGYESPSQFSREYGRQFGVPPKRDIAALRRQTNSIEAQQ
ncbi:transcriptional regulator, AraC family [Tolumonas auensis DSM 9187]|uniref:Transcriptional regulator, AraC family n=1 Tax=Tolumonas auensis (strain DSM 9187 / NBRC 110442 / TA 4) TaxID=595494 RepID=C4LG15_TOLAT|nr:AraC family transcriptional regulator [Tolumonas auensis]ACQ93532.1 transcriptional regulator, AraC family [Tolumonas auensis DSM 9187]